METRASLFSLFIRPSRYLSLFWVLSVCLFIGLGHATPRQNIAFVKHVDYGYKLHIMDIEHGILRKISDIPVLGCCPIWSPDGTQIAFNGNDRLPYVVDIFAGASRQLIASDATGWVAAWSPDSQSLILTESSTVRGFYRIDADGTNPRPLIDSSLDSITPVWSPDGRSIIYASGSDYMAKDIYRLDTADNTIRRLTAAQSNDLYPSISPDGQRIAFVSARDGNQDLYVMNADGSDVQRLTSTPGFEMSPEWSPDGLHILYMAWSNHMFVSSGDIEVIDADGRNAHQLISAFDYTYNSLPTWSPDSRQILFAAPNQARQTDLYLMDIDGSNVRQITFSADRDFFPAWQP
jgi:Tol biopolymer transport system component